MKLTVYSEDKLSEAIGILRSEWREHKYLSLSISTGKKRSLSQNALSHAWYTQVAREEQEYTPDEVKWLCKYHRGLPILRADDDEYNEMCSRVIDVLPYESRIAAMQYLPVTSLMNTKQLNEYLEQIQRNYAGRVDLRYQDED